MITIGYSTRESKPEVYEYLKKSSGVHKVQVIEKVNNGEKSLSQVYNEIINESENDIVVFMHDDLVLETPNMTPKIVKLFEKHPKYGIIGIAGTDKLTSGCWWENRENMFGVVGHIHEGKRHVNKYSKGSYNDVLKDVVIVDGLFFAVHKGRIKKEFNEQFEGFHFYDISFCVENLLEGVKIGLTTKFGVTHLSIGMTNKKWEKNKLFFEALFDKNLPLTS